MIRRSCTRRSMPAALQGLRMSPVVPAFRVALYVRTIQIMLSHGSVEHSVFASCPIIPKRIGVSVLSSPSRRRCREVGPPALQLGGDQLQTLATAMMV